jgi:NAD(P)H-quinone oxidoreductase subunit 4
MLREVFYGDKPQLQLDVFKADAKPREIFVALCLLIPVVGIGLYPKLATTTYDLKTVEIAQKARAAVPVIGQRENTWNASLQQSIASPAFIAPAIK